eukprot:748448-Hanusia_phi.AAC.2
MEEAASDRYLKALWASKRPGFMAGEGKTAYVPAQATSNRWAGKSYAAHLPDAAAIADGDKSYRIMQANMVNDPGEKNYGWEPDVTLQVIQSSSRQNAFQSIQHVAPLTLHEERAFASLEEEGWKKPFLVRQTENTKVSSREKIALRGTLRGSQPYSKRIATPNHILCAGSAISFTRRWSASTDFDERFCLPRQDYSDKSNESEIELVLLCGGSDGKVYRFQVSTDCKEPNILDKRNASVWSDGTEAPKISLAEVSLAKSSFLNVFQVSSCHSGPVNTIFTRTGFDAETVEFEYESDDPRAVLASRSSCAALLHHGGRRMHSRVAAVEGYSSLGRLPL